MWLPTEEGEEEGGGGGRRRRWEGARTVGGEGGGSVRRGLRDPEFIYGSYWWIILMKLCDKWPFSTRKSQKKKNTPQLACGSLSDIDLELLKSLNIEGHFSSEEDYTAAVRWLNQVYISAYLSKCSFQALVY